MIFLIISSCGGKEAKSPEIGAWQLHYSKRVAADTVAFEVVGFISGSEIKAWSGKNFISVGQFKQDTVYNDMYSGGSYTLNGNLYEETVLYHTNKANIGKTVKMLLGIKGDTLIQTWPVDKDGKLIDKNYYYIEKFIRVK
jgi:hypothetical protein